MSTYMVVTDEGTWLMQIDPNQASANISYSHVRGAPNWVHTPYQTADAQHSPQRAAELLAAYFGDEVGELAEEIESVEEKDA